MPASWWLGIAAFTGRTGPGAGRPAKLYRAVQRELAFSVPERRYEIAAAVLAQAVADGDAKAIPVTDALRMAARTFGRAMGAAAQGSRGDGGRESLERIAAVLVSYGYEPHIGPGDMNLVNCPYGALAAEHREVICSMNLRLLRGVLKGAEEKDLSARRENQPGHCCVTIRVRRETPDAAPRRISGNPTPHVDP
jgi:predicted ArsR family transcriptional regulator